MPKYQPLMMTNNLASLQQSHNRSLGRPAQPSLSKDGGELGKVISVVREKAAINAKTAPIESRGPFVKESQREIVPVKIGSVREKGYQYDSVTVAVWSDM